MLTIHTILSDTNLNTDFSQFPKNSQGGRKTSEEEKDDQRLDTSSARFVLFHGCCVV